MEDQEILDLIGVLDSVGHVERPNDELKRLAKEWDQNSPVYKLREKSPEEIRIVQEDILKVPADGIIGTLTKSAIISWSTVKFYHWMKERGKEVFFLEVQYESAFQSPEFMVLYKDYGVNFRRREVLRCTELDLSDGKIISSYRFWDEVPPGLRSYI